MSKSATIAVKVAKIAAVLVGGALIILLLFHVTQVILTWSSRSDVLLSLFVVAALVFYGVTRIISHYAKRAILFLWSVTRSAVAAVGKNPDVRRLAQRHPRLYKWLGRRLDPGSFSGLLTTVLVVVFAYTVILFVGVVSDVSGSGAIVAADQQIAALFELFRAPKAVKAFIWMTSFGDWKFISVAALCLTVLLWFRVRRAIAVSFLASLIGSAVSAAAIKWLVGRPRPDLGAIMTGSYSFPSAHAAVAVVFYGFLVFLVWRSRASWRKKFDTFFAAVAIVTVIGLSRIYLGVHYFSDVWAGLLLGGLWLIAAIGIGERQTFGAAEFFATARARRQPWVRYAAAAAVLATFVFTAMSEKPLPLPSGAGTVIRVIADSGMLLFDDPKIPRFTETIAATPQEPISMVILALDDRTLVSAFRDAGWSLADQINPSTVADLMGAAVVGGAYSTAPMTPSFWNGETHDFGFEKPAGTGGIRKRHHARFWRTDYRTTDGLAVYVGTASLDIGIKWFVTHRIAPDIDTERSFLIGDLMASGRVMALREADFIHPILGRNFARDQFFTDGKIEILKLK